ncbi:DUF4974 domain-containing protein [Prolixibacteraceae bacterium JC049]|nr:DUF4974 domain-containing protein [Prolixibacteraceae bacterium JC049]
MDKTEKDKHWELIAGAIHNELNDEEKVQLEILKQDKSFASDLKKAQSIRQSAYYTSVLKDSNKFSAWQQVKNALANQLFRISTISPIIRYAAIFIIALGIGILVEKEINSFFTTEQVCEIKAPLGQMSEITLLDGTKVWLNAGSELKYNNDFNKNKRSVFLSGEAFFKVTHDKNKPFYVENSHGKVKVLGTSFNVESYPDAQYLNVTLVEGSVLYIHKNREIALKPSQELAINKHQKTFAIRKVNTNFYTGWIEGRLVIENQPLSKIAQRLERWYNIDIQFASPQVADIQITGTILKNKPLDQMLTVLEKLYGFKYSLKINSHKKVRLLSILELK